jgi:hypothetical protein
MPDSTRRRWRDSLAVGRKRWLSAKPRSYRVEITEGCFCLQALGPVRLVVDVRDGRIARRQRLAAPPAETAATMQLWRRWTIDSLFFAADLALVREDRYVEAFELDPRYGFPRRVHTDVHGVTDSWSRFDVRSFAPLPPSDRRATVRLRSRATSRSARRSAPRRAARRRAARDGTASARRRR